ncbi:HTH-type transcriptional regulator YesS [Paenibacillus konkukensis]|uniref:HTH-type transcriptional regulator YesS n=1 Tax=Paenibacillus konkukensis TaxID=2020716 RepID=A0ABY4RKG2_9BACL|nr:helix-turn-helix domain-containing protein [Paenibacillus konkukensis]UQZ82959.1 HTH-type transcriptional regulator YesS [Paenibacillus konkukensis]
MKTSLSRSRLFKQIFLSHVLIFAIPFIILSAVVYYNAVVKFKSEIESSNMYKLNQVMNSFDLVAKGLDNTASRLSIDPKLTPFMVKNGTYKEIEAIEELAKYKANNAIVEELALYFHGDSQLYTSIGLNSLDTFTQRTYQFADMDSADLAKQMNELLLPRIQRVDTRLSGSDGEQTLLAFMYPIPRNSQSPYGTVVFLVRERVLADLVGPILGDFNGSVYISDAQNNIIVSSSRESKLAEPDAKQFLAQNGEQGIHDVSFQGESYSLMSMKSEITGWSYVAAMPTRQFLGRVLEMRTFILLVCLAVIVVGIVIAMLLSSRQYRPIRSIADQVRSMQGGKAAAEGRKVSELDLIRDSVRATEHLQEQIDQQRPIIREQFFVKLLAGAFQSRQELDAFIAREKFAFAGAAWFVAVASVGGGEYISTQSREELLGVLSTAALPHAERYGVEMIQDNAIVILFGTETGCDCTRDYREKAVQDIADLFERCSGIRPTIGVGNPVTELLYVNRSYIEASAAIEYSVRGRRGDIIFFDRISQLQESSDWYSVEEQIRLVQSMKQGNKEAAKESLQALLGDLKGKEVSLFYLRCMCFDLINTFLRTMKELQLTIQPEHRQMLTEFTSLEQLGQGMHGLIGDICDHANASKENKNSELGRDILAYIGDNFKLYDLNLEKISDHFQMSLSYFSRFMKEQTGYTFTEYVTHLRMEEVKRLLRTTDMAIKDIIASVGYSDVPNFMRKFKNSEGITLGQYRKLHT